MTLVCCGPSRGMLCMCAVSPQEKACTQYIQGENLRQHTFNKILKARRYYEFPLEGAKVKCV